MATVDFNFDVFLNGVLELSHAELVGMSFVIGLFIAVPILFVLDKIFRLNLNLPEQFVIYLCLTAQVLFSAVLLLLGAAIDNNHSFRDAILNAKNIAATIVLFLIPLVLEMWIIIRSVARNQD